MESRSSTKAQIRNDFQQGDVFSNQPKISIQKHRSLSSNRPSTAGPLVRAKLSDSAVLFRANKVRFYRNGDKYYGGIWFAVSHDKFRTFEALMEAINNTSLFDPYILPKGVRVIYNMQGETIMSLDQFVHGDSYVCSSGPAFQKVDYKNLSNISKFTAKSRVGLVSKVAEPLSVGDTEDCAILEPKVIYVIRAGKRPRKMTHVLLSKRTVSSFDQVLTDLALSLNMETSVIRQIYSLSGNQVRCVKDLYQDTEAFVAFGTDKFTEEDLTLNEAELKFVASTRKRSRQPVRQSSITDSPSKLLEDQASAPNMGIALKLPLDERVINSLTDCPTEASVLRQLTPNNLIFYPNQGCRSPSPYPQGHPQQYWVQQSYVPVNPNFPSHNPNFNYEAYESASRFSPKFDCNTGLPLPLHSDYDRPKKFSDVRFDGEYADQPPAHERRRSPSPQIDSSGHFERSGNGRRSPSNKPKMSDDSQMMRDGGEWRPRSPSERSPSSRTSGNKGSPTTHSPQRKVSINSTLRFESEREQMCRSPTLRGDNDRLPRERHIDGWTRSHKPAAAYQSDIMVSQSSLSEKSSLTSEIFPRDVSSRVDTAKQIFYTSPRSVSERLMPERRRRSPESRRRSPRPQHDGDCAKHISPEDLTERLMTETQHVSHDLSFDHGRQMYTSPRTVSERLMTNEFRRPVNVSSDQVFKDRLSTQVASPRRKDMRPVIPGKNIYESIRRPSSPLDAVDEDKFVDAFEGLCLATRSGNSSARSSVVQFESVNEIEEMEQSKDALLTRSALLAEKEQTMRSISELEEIMMNEMRRQDLLAAEQNPHSKVDSPAVLPDSAKQSTSDGTDPTGASDGAGEPQNESAVAAPKDAVQISPRKKILSTSKNKTAQSSEVKASVSFKPEEPEEPAKEDPPKQTDPEALPPSMLKKYRLGSLLQQNRWLTVKRCWDHKIKTMTMVVKIVDREQINYEEHVIALNEINIIRNLRHKNVVHLIDEFESQKKLYYIMENPRGKCLLDAIISLKKYTEKMASSLMFQLYFAINHLHSMKIIHRNIRPGNISVVGSDVATWNLKLYNFSLACEFTAPIQTACGTTAYMSPEMLSNSKYGPEADVWAAGIVGYIILCGFHPYESVKADKFELLKAIRAGELDLTTTDWEFVSENAKDLIAFMLEVDARGRCTSSEALEHPWITGESKDIKDRNLLPGIINSLKRTNASSEKAVEPEISLSCNVPIEGEEEYKDLGDVSNSLPASWKTTSPQARPPSPSKSSATSKPPSPSNPPSPSKPSATSKPPPTSKPSTKPPSRSSTISALNKASG